MGDYLTQKALSDRKGLLLESTNNKSLRAERKAIKQVQENTSQTLQKTKQILDELNSVRCNNSILIEDINLLREDLLKNASREDVELLVESENRIKVLSQNLMLIEILSQKNNMIASFVNHVNHVNAQFLEGPKLSIEELELNIKEQKKKMVLR